MNHGSKAFLIVVIAAAWLCGCSDEKAETAASPAPAAASPAAAAPTAAPSPANPDELLITGPLIVEHQVDVTALRDGVVASVSAEAGARVGAGAVLARLDDRQLSANLEASRAKTRGIADDLKNWEAEAQVLEADYVRAQRLFDEKLIADEQLQHAKYKAESDHWDILRVQEQLNTAKAEEHALELELEKTRIMREGQSVAKGDRLFWVTAEGPLRVRFTLPERFIGHVKKGQEMALTSLDLPKDRFAVRIVEVSPVVDPSSGTIELLAELTGPRGDLRPGMTVAVHVANLR